MARMQVWGAVGVTNFNVDRLAAGLPCLCQPCVYSVDGAEGAKRKKIMNA